MEPTFDDYVALIYNCFETFTQASDAVQCAGRPFVYQQKNMIVFFMWMQFKRIYQFKTQWRWLTQHGEVLSVLEWKQVPHRTTLSRRYKQLYPVLEDFVVYLAQVSESLGDEMDVSHLYEDKSLFKAQGPVWHQSDRQQGHIPEKLRNLDTDATWSKSAYHGWVYGYGLHLTCNHKGFPVLMQVETASYSEKRSLTHKETVILESIKPKTFCGDDAYTQAMRIRDWARQDVILWHLLSVGARGATPKLIVNSSNSLI